MTKEELRDAEERTDEVRGPTGGTESTNEDWSKIRNVPRDNNRDVRAAFNDERQFRVSSNRDGKLSERETEEVTHRSYSFHQLENGRIDTSSQKLDTELLLAQRPELLRIFL